MVDFAKLRQRKTSNFDQLQKSLEKTSGGGGFKKDERLWKYGNKDGKSSSVIRFLPISLVDFQKVDEGLFTESDLTPIATIIKHSFQGPSGQWFIENSLQTFGEACPVRELDGPKWKGASDQEKEALKPRLPRTTHTACIYVISDSVNPENNGKVFLFEFGNAVMKFIEKAGKPEFEGEVAFDPFDPWEGADLVLNLVFEKRKIGSREVDVPKFDNVKWAAPAPFLGGDDDKIKEVWEKQYSLLEFYDRANFKTYDELKEKLYKVMGLAEDGNPDGTGSSLGQGARDRLRESEPSADAPQAKSAAAPAAAPATLGQTVESQQEADNDEAMAAFDALLKG